MSALPTIIVVVFLALLVIWIISAFTGGRGGRS